MGCSHTSHLEPPLPSIWSLCQRMEACHPIKHTEVWTRDVHLTPVCPLISLLKVYKLNFRLWLIGSLERLAMVFMVLSTSKGLPPWSDFSHGSSSRSPVCMVCITQSWGPRGDGLSRVISSGIIQLHLFLIVPAQMLSVYPHSHFSHFHKELLI